ncbi:MAG TPA: SDR family oxidoreductase [Chloroflexi bacterium]|nr:SDR family oxidoreductase [Chloroflexota bacterium]
MTNDKVAIVTGAGRKNGIGAAIARQLAREGVNVVAADICAPTSDLPNAGSAAWEELKAVAAEIEALGARSLAVKVDVTDAASVEAMAAQTKERFGRLDILVNNAGAAIGPGPVLLMAEEAWRRTLEINATGTFLCCKHALPLMIEGGNGGRIVNMASIAAEKPKPFVSAYAASKAAVVALTRSLAQEVAERDITVNAVLPGDVDTAMKQWGLQLESLVKQQPYEEVLASALARIPLGRLASPEDIAQLVAFLTSEGAGFITGQACNITGGRELS